MTLPFIFCSLVSNSRRVPDRSTRNNRLARFPPFENAFQTFKISAKVRDVSPDKTRSKRSLKNRTVRPFFQRGRRFRRVGLRKVAPNGVRSTSVCARRPARSLIENGKHEPTKQKIRFSKMIGYTTISLESSGNLPFSPIFLNFLSK